MRILRYWTLNGRMGNILNIGDLLKIGRSGDIIHYLFLIQEIDSTRVIIQRWSWPGSLFNA